MTKLEEANLRCEAMMRATGTGELMERPLLALFAVLAVIIALAFWL
jgi:hypothetical protein